MVKWSSELKEKIKNLLFDSEFCDITFGSSAIYFPINEKGAGVKLFLEKDNRDFSFNRQLKAFEANIAPWVTDKFEFECLVISCGEKDKLLRDAYKRDIYGYITQHAPTIDDTDRQYTSEQFSDLVSTMIDIGLSPSDLDERNLAFIEDRLVCVDFDRLSQGM